MKKIRMDIYLTYQQKNFLRVLSKLKGMSMGEIIRKAIDEYLEEAKNE